MRAPPPKHAHTTVEYNTLSTFVLELRLDRATVSCALVRVSPAFATAAASGERETPFPLRVADEVERFAIIQRHCAMLGERFKYKNILLVRGVKQTPSINTSPS